MSDHKIRAGYRVVGHNTADGQLHSWYFQDIESANNFAKRLCRDTGREVDVHKFLGSWRIAEPPVEFVEATDRETEPECNP